MRTPMPGELQTSVRTWEDARLPCRPFRYLMGIYGLSLSLLASTPNDYSSLRLDWWIDCLYRVLSAALRVLRDAR